MRRRLVGLALLGAVSCSDATGGLKGGDPIGPIAQQANCSATGAACQTWSYLYACYFGPSGVANCSAQGVCHATPAGFGASSSGYVCGSTADSCWQGITHANPSSFPTLVPSGAPNLKGAYLSKVLHAAGTSTMNNGANNNMPLAGDITGPPSYAFTDADRACLDGWIRAGAKND